MKTIDELNYLQYLVLFPAEWRCALSDYYIKTADSPSGRAFVLKDDEKPVAYAVLVRENDGWVLDYIFTDKSKRRMGCAEYLIREIVSRTENYLRVHIIRSHPFFDAVSACLNKLGFSVNDTSCVYTTAVGENLWKRMDEIQLVRMKEFLLRDGSCCIPFCEMDDSIKNQLLNSPTNRFSNTLNPASVLQNNGESIDLSISTVLVKNGELVAYTLITRPMQNSISIEQVSEAQNKIGTGMIVASVCASFEAVRKIPEITRMKMTISDKNTRSYRFAMKMLKGQEINAAKNFSFIINNAKELHR